MFTHTRHSYAKINGDVALARRVGHAANLPSVTYPNGRVPGQMRHIKDGMVAVVDPKSQKIITFYENVVETDLRPDQTDKDALTYRERHLAAQRKGNRG
jgi:hypothetical protein